MIYSYPYLRHHFFPPIYRKSPFSYNFDQQRNNEFYSAKECLNRNQKQKEEKSVLNEENMSFEDKPVFELFGIKLYFDDLLLLGLLFFLYSEDAQDKELFFALILLLLS